MQNPNQAQFDLLLKSAQYTLLAAKQFGIEKSQPNEYQGLLDEYKSALIKKLSSIYGLPINIPDAAEFQELKVLLENYIIELYTAKPKSNTQLAEELNNRLLLIQLLPYSMSDAKAAPTNKPQLNTDPINSYWYINNQPTKLELDDEWPLVDAFIADYCQQHGELRNLTRPLKIDRKTDIPGSRHSFIVLPSNEEPGYIIGALASGKREIEGILGYGASGEVKVMQLRDGSLMAIKIEPNSDSFIKATAINNLLYGLNLEPVKLIRSRPAATPWIKHRMIQDKAYGLQKIVTGQSIRSYLDASVSNRNMSEIQKLHIAIAVLKAMRFYLEKRILNNDLSLNNIIIRKTSEFSDTFEAEVVDFGFGEIIPRGQNYVALDSVQGTPGYLSPEIFNKPLDKKFRFSIDTDLYSYSQILRNLGLDSEKNKVLSYLATKDLYADNTAAMHENGLEYIELSIQDYEKQLKAAYQRRFEAFLGRYIEEKQAKIKRLPLGLDSAKQIAYAQRLAKIISIYSTSNSSISDTVTSILEILKANQDRHNKSYTATASTLNFKTLKYLPPELRDECFARLGIQGADRLEISNGTKLSQRKLLARYINNYTPAGAVGAYAADDDEKKTWQQVGVKENPSKDKRY